MARSVENVYADALVRIATESGKEEKLLENARLLLLAFRENPGFLSSVRRPELSASERLQAFSEVFGGVLEPEMQGFFATVFEKKREDRLVPVLERFTVKLEAAMGIGRAMITTAFPVTETKKTAIEARLKETAPYQTLIFQYETDPALVGGVVIRIGDRVVDGSVKNRLNLLTRELMKTRVE